MNILPIQDHVLLELNPVEEMFGDSDIMRPDIAKDKPVTGTVRAIGNGYYNHKSQWIPTTLGIGSRVICPWSMGHDLTINRKKYLMIRESDIVGIIET